MGGLGAPSTAPQPPLAATAASTPLVPLTYRDQLAQFKILEEKRYELIEVGIKRVVHTPRSQLM